MQLAALWTGRWGARSMKSFRNCGTAWPYSSQALHNAIDEPLDSLRFRANLLALSLLKIAHHRRVSCERGKCVAQSGFLKPS
jgi:hypothetical protein